MKTEKLIETLQDMDEGLESEVLINNSEIYAIVKDPCFQGGCAEVLKYNEQESEFIGAEIMSEGYKINLTPLSVESALIMKPYMPVKLKIHNHAMLDDYIRRLSQWRQHGEALNAEFKLAFPS